MQIRLCFILRSQISFRAFLYTLSLILAYGAELKPLDQHLKDIFALVKEPRAVFPCISVIQNTIINLRKGSSIYKQRNATLGKEDLKHFKLFTSGPFKDRQNILKVRSLPLGIIPCFDFRHFWYPISRQQNTYYHKHEGMKEAIRLVQIIAENTIDLLLWANEKASFEYLHYFYPGAKIVRICHPQNKLSRQVSKIDEEPYGLIVNSKRIPWIHFYDLSNDSVDDSNAYHGYCIRDLKKFSKSASPILIYKTLVQAGQWINPGTTVALALSLDHQICACFRWMTIPPLVGVSIDILRSLITIYCLFKEMSYIKEEKTYNDAACFLKPPFNLGFIDALSYFINTHDQDLGGLQFLFNLWPEGFCIKIKAVENYSLEASLNKLTYVPPSVHFYSQKDPLDSVANSEQSTQKGFHGFILNVPKDKNILINDSPMLSKQKQEILSRLSFRNNRVDSAKFESFVFMFNIAVPPRPDILHLLPAAKLSNSCSLLFHLYIWNYKIYDPFWIGNVLKRVSVFVEDTKSISSLISNMSVKLILLFNRLQYIDTGKIIGIDEISGKPYHAFTSGLLYWNCNFKPQSLIDIFLLTIDE